MGNNAIAGAARKQLSGRARPSLIVGMGDWRDCEDQIRAAPHFRPAADLVNAALPNRTKSILSKCAAGSAGTISRRQHAMFALESLSVKLGDRRSAWISRLPGRSPAAAINFPPIHLITATLEYSDAKFVTDLSRVMPIAGLICATPGLAERKKAAELPYKEWKDGIRARNLCIYDRVLKSQNIELAGVILGKTLGEVERGGLRNRWMFQTR